MTKPVVANYKLAWLLLTLLGVFGESAQGWAEIVPLRSTSVNLEREQRASKKHGFYRMKNSLALSFSKRNDIESFAKSSRKDLAPVADWPSMTRCQNVVPATTTTQGNTWSGLTPLQSKREEVEKLLGPARDSVGKTFIYETQAEKVHVWYSEGPCKASEIGEWNVPLGTVLQIRVYPKATILLRDLQLKMSKYKRIPDPNIPNWAFYKNQDDGVMVQTQLENGCEQVEIVTYEPKKEDSQLRCRTNGQQRNQNKLIYNHTER
jgi:hypothetical protein